jgi:hypothetical protein
LDQLIKVSPIFTRKNQFCARPIGVSAIGPSFPQSNIPIERLLKAQPDKRPKSSLCAQIIPTVEKFDKIKMTAVTSQEIEELNTLFAQLDQGLITMDEALFKLRGGSFGEAVVCLALIILLQYYDNMVEAFNQPVPPHMDFWGWLSGKYKLDKKPGFCPSEPYRVSRFDRDISAMANKMTLAQPDENGFVLTHDQALELLTKTYPGELGIVDNLTMDYWQGAKKIYHSESFGIKPGDYGMTQDQMDKIEKWDLTKYVQCGEKLPPIEMVKEYAKRVKETCLNEQAFRNNKGEYKERSVPQPTIIFSLKKSRLKITFNGNTGKLVTAQRVRVGGFNKYLKSIEKGNGVDNG